MDSAITNATDSAGNTAVRSGHFEWSNGSSGTIADYNLQNDVGNTIAAKELTEPSDIAAQPDLNGHGNMYSLHQAMIRDTTGELNLLVEQFAAESNEDSRVNLMSEILVKWAGIGRQFTNYHLGNYTDEKMNVLEGYFGRYMISNSEVLAPGQNTRIVITQQGLVTFNEAYREIFEGYYAGLMAQTHLKELYDKITCTWDMGKQEYVNDLSGVIAELKTNIANNPDEGKQLLSEFARSWRALNNGAEHSYFLPLREALIETDPDLAWVFDTGGLPIYGDGGMPLNVRSHVWGTANAEAIRGSLIQGDGVFCTGSGDDVVYGTSRNEWLISDDGDALLFGAGGNDRLWAGPGADILDGGEGNDQLLGETGDDTYIFRRGSGQDTIIDTDATAGNIDTIWLGSNLTADDIILTHVGDKLVLKIKDTTDTITVQDFFRNDSPLNRIEQIQFMDGTVLTEDDIMRESQVPTDGDDIFYGTSGNDTIYRMAA